MVRTGRPTKLTPGVQEIIMAVFRIGGTKETAASMAGIEYATLRNWELRGEGAHSGIYFDFIEAAKRATAELQARCLRNLHSALDANDPMLRQRASEWLLSHKWPEEFSQNRVLSVEVKETKTLILEERKVYVHQILSDPTTRALALQLAERVSRESRYTGEPGKNGSRPALADGASSDGSEPSAG